MRIIPVFILSLLGVAFGQMTVRLSDYSPTQFFLGEKSFVAVFVDGVSGNGSIEREQGIAPYVLENISGNADWLKPSGRPVYNSNLDNAYYHWQNNQNFWMELSGYAPAAGDYSGVLRVRNTETGETRQVPYSFRVINPPSNYYGIVIAMHDSAASYGRQMELYTSLKNTMSASMTLQSPYIDYYGTRQSGRQPVISVWKKPSNSCVQVLDCGQGNFVIRHRFSGDLTIGANARTGEFQIGYNEVAGSNDPYYYSPLQDKDILAFLDVNRGYDASTGTNMYVDYSAYRWATNYTARAMQRNLFYNPYEALYDHSGSLRWGSAPSWFSEQSCSEVRMTTSTTYDWQRFRTNSGMSGFCTDGLINAAPVIQFPTVGPDTIYEGEDYFMRPLVTDADGDDFTMELTGTHPDWIEVGTPADYWDDYENVVNNNVNTVANRKVFYVRSKYGDVRKAPVKATATYSYTVKVTDSFGASTTAIRTIVVRDGANHPAHTSSGIAVLVGDETWFKRYQLDVASGIVNFSGTPRTLSAGWHYDYFGTHAERSPTAPLPTAHHWYTDPNVDVSYEACGSGRFRLRYTGKAAITLQPNRSYQDSKTGFFYGSGGLMDKMDDWSISDFYAAGDTLRRRRYAPRAPLFDGDGSLLWGEAPAWAMDCGGYTSSSSQPPLSSSSMAVQSSSSSHSISSSSIPGNSSSWESSSSEMSSSSCSSSAISASSSSFNAFTDLAVQFSSNLASANSTNFDFNVVNNGTAAAAVGGYELRFYYSSEGSLDATHLVFENYQNLSMIQERNSIQCAEDRFAYKVRLAQGTQIEPQSSLPASPAHFSIHRDDWQNYSWAGIAGVALFDTQGNLVYGTEMWQCSGYTKKILKLAVYETVHLEGMSIPNGYVNEAIGSVQLEFRNDGDTSLAGPVYVDFFVTHPSGQVPMLAKGGDTLSIAGTSLSLGGGVSVSRMSSGDRHTFRFILDGGLPASSSSTITFTLLDQCITDCPTGSENDYKWSLADDWSATDGLSAPWNPVKTEKVAIYSSTGELVYGSPDTSAPSPDVQGVVAGEVVLSLAHASLTAPAQVANRTDAIMYSMGQLLSGGDFETDWIHGWKISGTAVSVRGNSPQGSRHLELSSGASITQDLPLQAGMLLADSGATCVFWHTGNLAIDVLKNGTSEDSRTISGGSAWERDTVFLAKSLFDGSAVYTLSIVANGAVYIDDAILIPSQHVQPSSYAVRFTGTANEELETRVYDGAEGLLVTDSERDAMGREWKKYLPFALPCNGAADCNSERKTEHNPGIAAGYYTAANPDYPDAGGVPYVETKWKPDPLATRDVEGAPGKAFGVDGNEHGVHLVEAYSSGVNLSGINLLDSASLNSAVAAVANGRAYDGVRNHHAMRDANPTHLWEMNVDQDGRRAFAVKDGEGRVIASGSLDSTGKLLARSINELDARGNIVKSHPPVSCGYTPRPANCVAPSEYGYDAQSQMVWSREPDAGETRTFYDLTGRVRATQTQRQIDSGAYSVVGYDHLDRIIYTGEWRPALDSGAARVYFNDVQNRNSPSVAELTSGTVTRTFYDRMPARDTLGVSLYPADIPASAFGFTRNRVAAVVSDVFADGSGNVVRVSTANSYDKYGRVLASYTFDPTMPADSLKMLAVISEYDLGGKATKVTKYPYGVAAGGVDRRIGERYTYDRLGRVDSIYVKNGYSNEKLLASYVYYPLGTLKSITMGANITVTYTYHISGAVKSATTSSKFQDKPLYKETLFYEDCGSTDCKPQYSGNVSQMTHYLAHNVNGVSNERNVTYIYDLLNRLEHVKDSEIPDMDEMFAYDAQGRIVQQLRGEKAGNADENRADGIYSYYENTNMLNSVSDGIGGSAEKRNMSNKDNFVYDRDGNLIEDKSKRMTIAYDWRGMPVEFKRQDKCYDIHEQVVCDSIKLEIAYDGAGSRVSKTLLRKLDGTTGWNLEKKTHYTGIGSEIRVDGQNGTKVVVNMPQGLGRYAIESDNGTSNGDEFYLKNHLGSTMMVAKVTGSNAPAEVSAVYDYRAFGEQITLSEPTDKVTETFTGKELDDETLLSNHGARMLDPMLGMWISVDPKRFFPSPYLYMGNGYNPIRYVDLTGEKPGDKFKTSDEAAKDWAVYVNPDSKKMNREAGTFIFETDDGMFKTLEHPLWGSIDEVRLFDLIMITKQHPSDDIAKIVGIAHTHGADDPRYDNENFSDGVDENGNSYGDIPLAKTLGMPNYLMTPSDNFMKYDPSTDEITNP